jgi:hypothetical protein
MLTLSNNLTLTPLARIKTKSNLLKITNLIIIERDRFDRERKKKLLLRETLCEIRKKN